MWEQLGIEGAWKITPRVHPDDRGWFKEGFKQELFEEATGHELEIAQMNVSNSKAGVIRGIHFSVLPVSQAKYVTAFSGAVLDVIVDIRTGSPTFGKWEAVLLDSADPTSVYLSEGLGHAFIALADNSTVAYLVSSGYAPGREFGVNPFDPAIGIDWPTKGLNGESIAPILSEKDRDAPTLKEAEDAGLLPSYEEILKFRQSLH